MSGVAPGRSQGPVCGGSSTSSMRRTTMSPTVQEGAGFCGAGAVFCEVMRSSSRSGLWGSGGARSRYRGGTDSLTLRHCVNGTSLPTLRQRLCVNVVRRVGPGSHRCGRAYVNAYVTVAAEAEQEIAAGRRRDRPPAWRGHRAARGRRLRAGPRPRSARGSSAGLAWDLSGRSRVRGSPAARRAGQPLLEANN